MYTNPTPEQLEKINQYVPANMDAFEASELVVLEFIATDNLLNRALGKWGKEELPKLADLLRGLPLTLDHNWREVDEVQGVCFDAEVRTYQTAPDWAINQADNADLNRSIATSEGYLQCIAMCAVMIDSPMLPPLRLGGVGKVSLGGFDYKTHVCPLCKISFEDDRCPHGMPDPWWGITSKTNPMVAPYYIRAGVFDLGELSVVLIPNMPAAGIINRQKVMR